MAEEPLIRPPDDLPRFFCDATRPAETWSNKPAAQGLTLEALKRTYQRLTTCALCGRSIIAERRLLYIGGDRVTHVTCPPLEAG